MNSWPAKKLCDIADIRVSNVDKKTSSIEQPVRLCNYMDVYTHDYIVDSLNFMEATASPNEIEKFGLRSGDVIVTKDSESPDDIGIPSVVFGKVDGLVCGYHLALIRPDEREIDPVFLSKQLSTSGVARYFAIHASGSTRFSLSIGTIEQTEILAPSKPEQTQIATVLSTVDRAIAQTETLIAKQQRIKTGLMQDLLTKGIDENGNIRSESTHRFKDSPLGRIPEDWECTTIGQILEKYGGKLQTGPFGSQLHASEYVADGVPFVMPQDIQSPDISEKNVARIPEDRANDLERHRMLPNDLIFARRGDLSRCAFIKQDQKGWVCGSGCFLMRPPQKALSSKWMAEIYRYYTTQLQIGIQAVGSTMVNLNIGIMASLKISLPKYEEQVLIEERLREIEQAENILEESCSKIKRQKLGLMQDLLTGKVPVTPLLEPTPFGQA
ncbi:restriction endonuclease subunit S [Leptolyngbya sp. KIOST-1]|uniref:restriction endonuclease subunit S n=1 Tax=Leptolyngbya sp. KIOST-1 TaxID=1229172 RepID=UPI00055FE2B9|nr:restriction endonuclease subunit S [Leptolyngbya sp. KIOST-1]